VLKKKSPRKRKEGGEERSLEAKARLGGQVWVVGGRGTLEKRRPLYYCRVEKSELGGIVGPPIIAICIEGGKIMV